MKSFKCVKKIGKLRKVPELSRKKVPSLCLLFFPKHDLGMRFRLRNQRLVRTWNSGFPVADSCPELSVEERRITYQNCKEATSSNLDFRLFARVGTWHKGGKSEAHVFASHVKYFFTQQVNSPRT